MDERSTERVSTLVIGGGQAGLTMGYELRQCGLPFRILDSNARIGDAWRNRWDSLRLFTPARYAGLPGLAFPGRGDSFPTKDDVAAYLETYAKHVRLPVQTGVKVTRVSKLGDGFLVEAGPRKFEADQVVIAMANYQVPRVPEFAKELDPDIVQLHSHSYRNTSHLRPGSVLVVGVGNSGADIAMEVVRSHQTWMSGKESGHVPFQIESFVARHLLVRLVRFVGHHVLSLGSPIGRKVRPKLLTKASPLVRVKPKDLTEAGVERVARVTGVQNGRPLLADGRVLDVANVIWCTGYEPGFSWIDLPIFEKGRPMHHRGVVHRVPGMYFVGLHFLYAMSSATLIGIGRDAAYVAEAVKDRVSRREREAGKHAEKQSSSPGAKKVAMAS